MDQAAGKRAAFIDSLEIRLKDIYSYFRRLGVDAASADDLVQETFVLAWQGLPGLRDENTLRSWLYSIAHRRYLRFRASRYAKATIAIVEDVLAEPNHNLSSDELIESHVVLQALRSLPEKYFHPLVLVFWEDLSYQEAAAVLSLPAGTFAWRVHKALKLIKRTLVEKGDGHEIGLPRPKAVGATGSLYKN